MNKTILALALVMSASTLLASEKIAVVNMVDLVRHHPSRERDRKLMEETEKEFQSKLDKQRDRFEELRGDYEKVVKEARNPALNDTARLEAEDNAIKHREVLAQAERDLLNERKKLQEELGDLDARLLRQITTELRTLITKYAEEKKLDAVYDSTTMAYFNPRLEVTDEILRRMDVNPSVRKQQPETDKKDTAAAEQK
jgi:Skp family chaperone for outer membrane proteins